MFSLSRSHTETLNTRSRALDLMYYIVTNNLNIIKELKLVNSANVNEFIELTNNMTALHYAAQLPDDAIEKYLLSLGANPNIKNKYNQDVYDISIKFNKRSLFDAKIQSVQVEVRDLKSENLILKKRTRDTEDTISYLNESCNNYKNKVQKLTNENKILQSNLDEIKIKNSIILKDLGNSNLKNSKLETVIDNFIDNNKKK